MGDHEERTAPAAPAAPAARTRHLRADQFQEDVTEALIPRGLAVRGYLACLGFESCLDLGVRVGGQLSRQGAMVIVEAQGASFVIGLGRVDGRSRSRSRSRSR